MKLFGKKKETKTCCCGGNCTSETMENTESKKQEKGIKILGSGCIKCMELEKTARTAISELQLDYEIDHVTDFVEIAGYRVMSTPALVIDGEVISYGKVLYVFIIPAVVKLLSEIPPVDIVITMGCNVNCPIIPCQYREDWGLNDPTGKDDVEFSKTIHAIHARILELAEKIKKS